MTAYNSYSDDGERARGLDYFGIKTRSVELREWAELHGEDV